MRPSVTGYLVTLVGQCTQRKRQHCRHTALSTGQLPRHHDHFCKALSTNRGRERLKNDHRGSATPPAVFNECQ